MPSRIDIAFCVNDGYARYIGVTIKSICENNKQNYVHIHVLTDHISYKNQFFLNEIVADYDNTTLTIYVVDDSKLRGLKDTWSIYTWYRVLIPNLLPKDINRVLYLDADTLVVGDLSDLFSMDMTDKAIGCAIDIETFNEDTIKRCGFSQGMEYVCAGVMLMNLDYWRENELSEKIVKFGFDNNDRIKFPDQDTINILCQDHKIVLPMKWGVQNVFFTYPKFKEHYPQQLKEAEADPRIIHFAGCAPWIKEFDNTKYHPLWMKYSKMMMHPVFPKLQTKGLNGLKVRVFRLFHKR